MTTNKISREKDSVSSEQIHQRLKSASENGSLSFVTELLAIEHLLPFQDEGFLGAVSDFLNNQKLDLFSITTNAVTSGQDIFRVAHMITIIFPKLNEIEPSSLLSFLKIYDEKTKNDLMGGQLFEPIRKRTILNKEWGLNLEKVILEDNDKRFYWHLLAVYLAFSDLDYDFGYGKIKSAYTSTVQELKTIGLRGIGLLGKLSDEHRTESFKALILEVDDKNEVIATNAAFSISYRYGESVELSQKRIALSKSASPGVRFEILRQVQFKQGQLDSDDIEIIKHLCAYDLILKGITDSLDSIIYFLVSKGYAETAKDILTIWVSSHSFEEHQQHNFTEQFNSSIFEILKNKSLIETIISEWFNSDDFRYHHVLLEIISYMGVHGVRNPRLNLDILKSFGDDDFLYIIRKILGFTHDFDISISLVLSILDLESLSNKTAGLVASVLIEHIGENYLVKTLDRLNLEIKICSPGTEKFKAINQAITELQKRKDQRTALANRNELIPNADHQAELNKALHKSMTASMKEARKKSVIQSLFAQVAIKSGRSTFSFTNGEYREPSKMSSYSHGIELPKKDVLDEVGASFERSGFRLAKRGER